MTQIYIVRWKCGSYSLLFGTPEGLFLSLDRIGSPSEAQVRIVPQDVIDRLWIDDSPEGGVTLSYDLPDIWAESSKQVWPLEELGS